MNRAKAIKKTRETSITSSKKEYRGLCMACKNSSTCTYPRDINKPVLQCESFEDYITLLVKMRDEIKLPIIDLNAKSDIESTEQSKYKGLCKSCEDRKTCTYPKPESGVWRCEDYK